MTNHAADLAPRRRKASRLASLVSGAIIMEGTPPQVALADRMQLTVWRKIGQQIEGRDLGVYPADHRFHPLSFTR